MPTFTCFASTYDVIEDVECDLRFDPLDFKRTMSLLAQGRTIKSAMRKIVHTNEFNEFFEKHSHQGSIYLYFLDDNGKISKFKEIIDI